MEGGRGVVRENVDGASPGSIETSPLLTNINEGDLG